MPVDNVLARRKWAAGNWPQTPQRGIDGRMYGPGYDADPEDGTDSSPVQKMYGSSWLDNVVKLYDNGMLHPKVMQMLEPQIQAMIRSQSRRGQSFVDDEQLPGGGGDGAGRGQLHHDEDLRDAKRRY